MTVGEEYEASKKILIHELGDWETQLVDAHTHLNELTRDKDKVEDGPLKASLQTVDFAREKIETVRKDITLAKKNLDRIAELFNARAASHEVTKSVIEAWPPRRFSERLLWIGYALIPAGGVQFALVGEYPATVLMWVFGAYSIAFALADLARHDNKKFRYFKKEVGIEDEGPMENIIRLFIEGPIDNIIRLLIKRPSEGRPEKRKVKEV